jgi:hypothetical protein
MGTVMDISFLAESDRARWDVLARGKDTYFHVERSHDAYERTWRRLLDADRIHGIAARVDCKMVAIAHYLSTPVSGTPGKCYLADLFVDADTRLRGIATSIIN